MKKVILSRCGNRCDLCLAYKDNIAKHDQRALLSDTWFKIYGFRIPPEEIYCDGCLADCKSESYQLINEQCPVRQCVIGKGLENCSQCNEYPCEKFQQRVVISENLLENNPDISKHEYTIGIKPYENKNRIDWLRFRSKENVRLLNPEIKPSNSSIQKFIQKPAVLFAWNRLTDFMERYPGIKSEIYFSGRKYGWVLQFRQGRKTIVTFFPHRNNFTVLITLRRNELALFKNKKHLFSKEIIQHISQTKISNNIKMVWIQVKNEQLVPGIKKLIQLKHQTSARTKV